MCRRLLVSVAVVFVLSGCVSTPTPAPQVQSCPFVLAAEVDGVVVTSPTGEVKTSKAGQRLVFSLPCSPQSFRLEKACYPSQQVAVASGEGAVHVLKAETWEKFGYFRVENGSASEYVEVKNLPVGPLRVPSHEHSVRRMPLGAYLIEVTAPFKEPVERELRLCEEHEIYSLRVNTDGADGELVAEGAQDVTLVHGTGQLRVVTEVPNLSFRITPDRSEELREYLNKVGMKKLAEIEVESAPVGIRQALALLQRLDAESFLAPVAITLPAGRYFIEHSLMEEEEKPMVVEVQPGREMRVKVFGPSR